MGLDVVAVPTETATPLLGPGAGALDRGLAILSHLSRVRSCTTPELADALGLSRSTTYRLVERLRDSGWLVDDQSGHLRLGPAAARLASAAVASTNLKDVAVPALHELLTATQETVSLAVPNELTMVFVHRERGPRPVGVSAELGTSRPLHCTSVGRAYLAALPSEQCENVLDALVRSPLSPVEESSIGSLREEIARTRQRGWSQDLREFDQSSCCCGAAIFDHTGQPIAAISVAGVAERMEGSLGDIGPLVQKSAATISASLGYVEPLE
ncbi:IclR family transcriptional regulator [Rhodococcus sp. NPDC127530]|uniref:IclR family transcriptional regulator n=1 Tax=unclassified Rhodococcus (in: high G+C Gram-positive bacteria) TaxID=192944 RepID=UPI003638A398